MPSYTKEQREAALALLDECEGSPTQVKRRLGYPTRQTLYQWINENDEVHNRTAGWRWSHYDPALKREAVRLISEGMPGRAVAEALGVSGAAVVCNWARKAEEPGSRARSPVMPMDSEERAYDGFDGDENERIRQLELQNDILREVVARLKGESPSAMTNREKALVIEALRLKTGRPLKELIASLRISKSSYEYQRRALSRGDKYAAVRAKVVEVFEAANRTRGYRYVIHELRRLEDPIVVSEKVDRAIMREEGCRVIYQKKARKYSSYAGEISDAPPNLVERDFSAGAPNELWLSDITEFGLPCGECYLSPVLDCFDGRLVSWSMGTSPGAKLANDSLTAACATLADGQHPVCHTDRGCHYRWPGWILICERNGLTRSMSKKGCSPANAAMEGFFGRVKNEFFYFRDWRGVTMDEFMPMLDSYLRFYNEDRVKESLGWLSPNQYRRSLGMVA